MAQLVVRNIESAVKTRLKRRAQSHGRSMEEEVREILRNVVNQEEEPKATGLGTRIAARFSKCGLEPGETIPELRGGWIKPPSFEP